MKNRYKQTFDTLSISDEGREKFYTVLEKGGHMRKSRLMPIAAAAALIILSAMLIFPKNTAAPTVSAEDEPERPIVINEYSGEEESSYEVVAELTAHKLDEFSSELQADIATGKVERAFDSREELEAYLGIELISAPELEAAGSVSDLADSYANNFEIVRPQYKFAPEARYVVTGVDLRGEPSAQPAAIKVSFHRVIRNTECYIDALILTEYAEFNASTAAVLGEKYPALIGIHNDMWVDENGQFQAKATQYKSAIKDFSVKQYEMPNGCTATIVTATDVCPICTDDNCAAFREYIGHFVSGGILYSVLPYAIFDPSQNFPSQDSDCLSVLRSVLQMFE